MVLPIKTPLRRLMVAPIPVIILLLLLMTIVFFDVQQHLTNHALKVTYHRKDNPLPDDIHRRVACSPSKASTGFALAKYYSSHMVLQRAPVNPRIWGYADNVGDVILVGIEGVQTVRANATSGKAGRPIWQAVFRPLSGMGPYRIIVVNVAKNCHVTLVDVLVGDVWICSGQSNMWHMMEQIDNPEPDITDAVNYPNVRMFISDRQYQNESQEDLVVANFIWARPDAGATIRQFSAVCWLFGRNLWRKLQRPIGLVMNAIGSARIEAWSSPKALSVCFPPGYKFVRDYNEWNEASFLWNALIQPFLQMPIYGVIWYQGEQNTGNPKEYTCALKALVNDWRTSWHEKSPQMDPVFPFGEVQLAPFRELTNDIGFSNVRWAQTGGYGYTPNADFDKIFMAVAVDLPDYTSPYLSIHPRYKRQIADRLALAGLAVAYGRSDVGLYQGPIPIQVELTSTFVKLEYRVTIQVHQYQKWSGFELCCSSLKSDSTCSGKSSWKVTDIVDKGSFHVDLHNVCLGDVNSNVIGFRYLWRESPCALEACAVYSIENKLPAPPYRIFFDALQADKGAVQVLHRNNSNALEL